MKIPELTGQEQVILPSNISKAPASLFMPPGLEVALPPPAMADLLAYLRGQ